MWPIVGGLLGQTASLVLGMSRQQALLLKVIVGIVGALVAGWFLAPLSHLPTINQNIVNLPALLTSLLGVILLLAVSTSFAGYWCAESRLAFAYKHPFGASEPPGRRAERYK